MCRKRKARRQTHGSAWPWNRTDCWYYTMPGTKGRIGLFDEVGPSRFLVNERLVFFDAIEDSFFVARRWNFGRRLCVQYYP